jgi:protoheme IX farnesyltransferase
MQSRFSIYAELSKSGIVALVLISVLGGYLAGHPFEQAFSWGRLGWTLLGILCLASGSSALNQFQERKDDLSMPRTAKRPLPSGRLSVREALTFIASTLLIGLGILAQLGGDLLVLGLAAVVLYNGLYTLWWKRNWSYAAVPGAVPGALPILMGYAAASGETWAPGGLYLFSLLFFWQMPHFWVLALKYRSDYEQGGFPTLSVTHGEGPTVRQIGIWSLAYVALSLAAPIFLQVHSLYLLIALAVGALILKELRAFTLAPDSRKWLHFFLWVNVSLILYIGAAVADLWSIYLRAWITR